MVDDKKILEAWKAHYDKISNEEFMWNEESIVGRMRSYLMMK